MVQDYTSGLRVHMQAHMVWSSTTPTAPTGWADQPNIEPNTRKTTLKQAQEKPSTRHGVIHDVGGCCHSNMVKYFCVGRGTVGVGPKLTITQHSTVSTLTGHIITVKGYVLFITVYAILSTQPIAQQV